MTASRLLACVNGTPMGVIERDRGGRLRFVYDDAWRQRGDVIALSLSMPLIRREHPHAAIDAFLWGLLPDNEQTLARWASSSRFPRATRLACLPTWAKTAPVRCNSSRRIDWP